MEDMRGTIWSAGERDPYTTHEDFLRGLKASHEAWRESVRRRAAELLPSIDAELSERVLLALLSAADDDARYSALSDAATVAGIDVAAAIDAAAIAGDLFDDAPGFADADSALLNAGRVPFDPTMHRPRTHGAHGVAVRGDRHLTYVIDGEGNRMATDEAIERADAWLACHGESLPMIGTETTSWEEVIHAREADAVTHGMGASVVGRDSSRKVRANNGHRSATYPAVLVGIPTRQTNGKPRHVPHAMTATAAMGRGYRMVQAPADVVTFGVWPMATAARVRKSFTTRRRVRVGERVVIVPYGQHRYADGTYGAMLTRAMVVPVFRSVSVIGHGKWSDAPAYRAPGAPGATRSKRIAPVHVADVAAAIEAAEALATDALGNKDDRRGAWVMPDGRKVTVHASTTRNRVRVEVTTLGADGKAVRSGTTVHKVAAVGAAIRNRTR